MTLRNDYSTETLEFPNHSAPEIIDTVEIQGRRINIVRYATVELRAKDAEPVFGNTATFYAVPADAEFHTLSRTFFINDGDHHKAGQPSGGYTCAYVKNSVEMARSATAKGAVKSATDRVENDRLYATYAPVAQANCRTSHRDEFDTLDPNADIAPGDLVIVHSHQRYRVGVAIKTTRTKVSCLATTPTGGTNGVTRTKGVEVRLLAKRTADPAPATDLLAETSAMLDDLEKRYAIEDQGNAQTDVVDQDTAAPVLGMTGEQVAEMIAPRTDEPVGQGDEDPVLRDAHAEDCEVYLGHFSRATWDRCTCRVGVARMRAKLLAAGRIGAPLPGDDEVRALYAAVIAGGPVAEAVDQGDAVAAPAQWPVGKTFGDLDPATRAAVVAQAAATLTGELAATGDALSAVLDGWDKDNQCRGCGAHISEPHGPVEGGKACPNNPDPVAPVMAVGQSTPRPDYAAPSGGERVGEHWNARMIREQSALEGSALPTSADDEELRCVAGRVAASMMGQADAVPGCTLYRMVHARGGARVLRLHDEGGELLAVLSETPDGRWFAVLSDSDRLVPGPDGFAEFGEVVAAVRSEAVPAAGC